MNNSLPIFLMLAALVFSAVAPLATTPEPKDWRDLLDKPLDDEWMQVFGIGGRLTVLRGRPAETLAQKFVALQELIAKSNPQGLTVPVFLTPDLASMHCEAIPATPPNPVRAGSSFTQVPVIEVFRYVGEKYHWNIIQTEHGILLKPKRKD